MQSELKRLCLLGGMLIVFLLPCEAQEFRATVSGQVTDASGAVMPGATIAARNVATNATYKTESGDDGEYALRNLDPGNYVITVEKTGFRRLAAKASCCRCRTRRR